MPTSVKPNVVLDGFDSWMLEVVIDKLVHILRAVLFNWILDNIINIRKYTNKHQRMEEMTVFIWILLAAKLLQVESLRKGMIWLLKSSKW